MYPSYPLSPTATSRWRRHLPLVGLLALATALRVAAPDLSSFKLDEVDALSRARALVERGVIPATGGMMSWGLPDPPLMIYLLALPRLVSYEPALAVVFLGLLNTAAVALTWILGTRFFGRRAGFAAAILYAASPWGVYFARNPWVHVAPLLTAGALFSAMQVVVHRRYRWGALFFISLALQSQTHLIAVLYLPAIALTVFTFPRRWLRLPSLLGLALGLAMTAPYVAMVWPMRDAFGATIAQRATPSGGPTWLALELNLWAASGFNLQDLFGGYVADFEPFGIALSIVHGAVVGLVAVGTIRSAFVVARRLPGWEASLLLLVWAWPPVLLLAWFSPVVPLHYFTLLYPTQFLLAGTGFSWLGRAFVRPWSIQAGLLASSAGVQTAALVALAIQLPFADLGGGHGLSAGVWERVASNTRDFARAEGADETTVSTRGSNPAQEDFPAALAYFLQPDLPVRFLDGSALVLPLDRPMIHLNLRGQSSAALLLDRFAVPLGSLALSGRADALYYRVGPYTEEQVAALPSHRGRQSLSRGVSFLGYDVGGEFAPGKTITITTYWLMDAITDLEREDDLTLFAHVLDTTGRKVTQRDSVGMPSSAWRSGEALVQLHEIELPRDLAPGTYTMRYGVYSRKSGLRATLVGRALQADALELGPWVVAAR